MLCYEVGFAFHATDDLSTYQVFFYFLLNNIDIEAIIGTLYYSKKKKLILQIIY